MQLAAYILVMLSALSYPAAGLDMPNIEAVHWEEHCEAVGYYDNGEITLCGYLSEYAVSHEVAHAWIEQNVDDAQRQQYMALFGLPSWDDRDDLWELRGAEHSTFILQWGMGEDCDQVRGFDPAFDLFESGYETLTGEPPSCL